MGAVAPILALKAVLLQVLPVPAPRTFSEHSGIKFVFLFLGRERGSFQAFNLFVILVAWPRAINENLKRIKLSKKQLGHLHGWAEVFIRAAGLLLSPLFFQFGWKHASIC